MGKQRGVAPTSLAAYRNAKAKGLTDERRVLNYLDSVGPRGATNDEGCKGLKMPLQTYIARRRALVEKGEAFLNGRKRLTKCGQRADVIVSALHATARCRAVTEDYLEKLRLKRADYRLARDVRQELKILKGTIKRHGNVEDRDAWRRLDAMTSKKNWEKK